MPQQEPGVRPSAALPYELAADGALSADGKRFEITLEARNSAFGAAALGAPFHVYTPGTYRRKAALRTRAYAVAAGDSLTDGWDLDGFVNGIYHLRICGPNGFLREFAGSADDPRLTMQCVYPRADDVLTGDIEMHFNNPAEEAVTLEVKDHGYRSGDYTVTLDPDSSQTLTLSLDGSHHWYDFSVTAAGAEQFLRRFAGRVETGQSGFSDPVMGRIWAS